MMLSYTFILELFLNTEGGNKKIKIKKGNPDEKKKKRQKSRKREILHMENFSNVSMFTAERP